MKYGIFGNVFKFTILKETRSAVVAAQSAVRHPLAPGVLRGCPALGHEPAAPLSYERMARSPRSRPDFQTE
jgi:hypothetical protein